MRKQKKKKTPVRLVLFLAVLVAIAGVAVFYIERHTPSSEHMDLNEYFGTEETTAGTGAETLAVVTDGVTADGGAIRDGGTLYISYPAVAGGVNPRVYYDKTEQLLIVTTPTTKTQYDMRDAANSSIAKLVQNELFVSAEFLKTCTDMEMTEESDPARLVITTDFDYTGEELIQDAPVRYRAGIKSPILEDLSVGETVRARDVSADGTASDDKVDGWTYVTTADGVTGYVEDRYLGAPHEVTVPHNSVVGEYTSITKNYPINLAFHQTTNATANGTFSSLIANASSVNTVAPTWFFLSGTDGTITSNADAAYVTDAHNRGLEVWAVVNDFDGDVNSADATAAALAATSARTNIINTVIQQVTAVGADGVNVDFEHVTADSADAFLEFIRELSVECRTRGLVLSVDNYVPAYTQYMNRKEQGIVADYVVTMCYDENTSGAEKAGSVSSLPYVRQGIEDTLKEVPASKLIAAIPFYTRLWTTDENGHLDSTACGMEDAQRCVENYEMTVRWDADLGQNYASATVGGIKYEMWMEDADSVAEKMKLIKDAGCAGVAEWKLGQETPDIWQVIASGL